MAATKEQERKVLEQIRKMVEELGADSYIAMAFEGCFEIAESNIDNDFGCSMKQRSEHAEMEAAKYKKMFDNVSEDFEYMQAKVETFDEKMASVEEARDYFQKEANRLSEIVEKQEKEKRNLTKEQQERADRLEDENIRLKAKLYDLICK